MHIRWLVGAVLLCAMVFAARGPDPGYVRAYSDADHDDIDDAVEMDLAQRFRPTIWHSTDEGCPNPTPRPLLFRVRFPSVWGVRYMNYILINYVELYDDDCGINGHEGDNEPFEVWLQWNGSDWQYVGVSATAHYDTSFEKRTMSFDRVVWVGDDKHGHYADRNQCGIAFSTGDECDEGFTFLYSLYNVGEPYGWMLNNLGDVYQPWTGERVWDDSRFREAGVIRDQLAHNRFDAVVSAPGYWPCRSQCDQQLSDCINSNPPDPNMCYLQHQDCEGSCWYYNSWDDGYREYRPGSPPPPGGGTLIFYEHINFEGGSFSAGIGDIPFVGWDWNDRISSIWIPDGRTVVLYEHADFGGESLTLTTGVADLRNVGELGYGWWNDRVSSIRVF